jgi:putative nucleotidyltransferase with HDIG domain
MEKYNLSSKIQTYDKNNYDLNALIYELNAKSRYTLNHTSKVSMLSLKIGMAMNFSKKQMKKLKYASLLHDVGKIVIPDSILNNPGKLTKEEYEVIKGHCLAGFELVKKFKGFEEISQIILCHHERYDGNGYPNKIKGEDIPLMSRIISVADSFDAMVSERPYKKSMSVSNAVEELKRCKWGQFDGNIVDIFASILSSDPDLKYI